MRLGAIVLFYNGLCYQSYQWRYYRPLGTLQTVINSLESYGMDEICIIRPSRKIIDLDVRNKDLDIIRKLDCLTPVSFGGGIRSIDDISDLTTLPVERFVLSSQFIKPNITLLRAMINQFGRQAIQALLPVAFSNSEELIVYDCHNDEAQPLNNICSNALTEYANEVILYDTQNEGRGSFDMRIIEQCGIPCSKLIIGGGVDSANYQKMRGIGGAAMLVENRVLHTEYSKRRFIDE